MVGKSTVKPLHKLNPQRILYIRQQIEAHFQCDGLKGKSILDVGCGGGLVCEPLARLGAKMSGADADAQAIEVASTHAQGQGLSISYHNKAIEEIDQKFDVVLALEIIEHVNDPAAFVQACAARVKDGGLLILSTLNRTPHSFLGGIVAAEYLLRWVPQGTHNWRKFLRPSELGAMVRASGLEACDVTGLHYNPLDDAFSLSKDRLKVNYLLSAVKDSR